MMLISGNNNNPATNRMTYSQNPQSISFKAVKWPKDEQIISAIESDLRICYKKSYVSEKTISSNVNSILEKIKKTYKCIIDFAAPIPEEELRLDASISPTNGLSNMLIAVYKNDILIQPINDSTINCADTFTLEGKLVRKSRVKEMLEEALEQSGVGYKRESLQ